MTYLRGIMLALLAGAVAGALVLGLAGRAATIGVALVAGNALNLSVRGILEVMVVGALLGAVGGVLLLTIRSAHDGIQAGRGATAGAILFLASLLLARISGRIAFESSSVQFFTLVIVAVMFLGFGICADALLTRFEGGEGRGGHIDRMEA